MMIKRIKSHPIIRSIRSTFPHGCGTAPTRLTRLALTTRLGIGIRHSLAENETRFHRTGIVPRLEPLAFHKGRMDAYATLPACLPLPGPYPMPQFPIGTVTVLPQYMRLSIMAWNV